MKCKKCGAQIPENSSFCSVCGEKLGSDITASKTGNSKSGIIIIIIVLAILLLILGVFTILLALGIIKLGDKPSPVINTTETDKGTQKNIESNNNTKKYQIGDAVTTVDGSKWHVIGVKGDNVTLLLDDLVVEEMGYGQTASAEDQTYEKSYIKQHIEETYIPDLKSKITSSGGDASNIVGRIITAKEYLSLTKTEFNDNYTSTSYTSEAYNNKEFVCKMLDIMSLTKSFWTSSNVKDLDSSSSFYGAIYIFHESEKYSYFCSKTMSSNFAVVDLATSENYQIGGTAAGIRPVIETPSINIK